MDTDRAPGQEPSGKPSATLLITVGIVLFLAVAGVAAMVAPSGDQGQSKDPGTQVEVPGPPASQAQGGPTIESSTSATFVRAEAGGRALACRFTLAGVPDDRATVVHSVLSGTGTEPVPLLHPGEQAVDGVVEASDGPAGEFLVRQTIDAPKGDYSCKVVAVMTSSGPAELEGQTMAKVLP